VDAAWHGKEVVFKGLSLPFHVLRVESQALGVHLEGIVAAAWCLRARTQVTTGVYQVDTGVIQVDTSITQVN
jgi:hypothetical protein